jgi:hypothetical protein
MSRPYTPQVSPTHPHLSLFHLSHRSLCLSLSLLLSSHTHSHEMNSRLPQHILAFALHCCLLAVAIFACYSIATWIYTGAPMWINSYQILSEEVQLKRSLLSARVCGNDTSSFIVVDCSVIRSNSTAEQNHMLTSLRNAIVQLAEQDLIAHTLFVEMLSCDQIDGLCMSFCHFCLKQYMRCVLVVFICAAVFVLGHIFRAGTVKQGWCIYEIHQTAKQEAADRQAQADTEWTNELLSPISPEGSTFHSTFQQPPLFTIFESNQQPGGGGGGGGGVEGMRQRFTGQANA